MAWWLVGDGVNDRVNIPAWVPTSGEWRITVLCNFPALESDDYIIGHENGSDRKAKLAQVGSEIWLLDESDWTAGGAIKVGGIAVDTDYTIVAEQSGGVLSLTVNGGTPASASRSVAGASTVVSSIFDTLNGIRTSSMLFRSAFLEDLGNASNNRFYDTDASGGTGSVIPETINSQNGTLVNFPTDDSQWVSLGGGTTPVSQDLAIRYAVLNAIQADKSLLYQVLNSVSMDKALRYDVLNAVNQDAQLRYDVLNAISQDVQLRYEVQSSLSSISNDLAIRFAVLNAVERDLQPRYAVNNSVSQDAQLRYQVFNSVYADKALRFDVLNAISQDLAIRYGVEAALQAVQQDLQLRYDVLNSTEQTLVLRYVVDGGNTPDLIAGSIRINTETRQVEILSATPHITIH